MFSTLVPSDIKFRKMPYWQFNHEQIHYCQIFKSIKLLTTGNNFSYFSANTSADYNIVSQNIITPKEHVEKVLEQDLFGEKIWEFSENFVDINGKTDSLKFLGDQFHTVDANNPAIFCDKGPS
jgi:hypothetical protein